MANTWSLGPPFTTARRNFPADSDGIRIFLAGGYDRLAPPLNTMEIFTVPVAQSAVSRKAHGVAGNFDVPLPLIGAVGVESRRGGGSSSIPIRLSLALLIRLR